MAVEVEVAPTAQVSNATRPLVCDPWVADLRLLVPELPEPDDVVGAHQLGSLGDCCDKEQYRYIYLAKNNRREDNYAPLMARLGQFDAMYSDDNFLAHGLEEVINVEQFLRGFAFAAMSGARDNWGTSSGLQHNVQFFVEPAGGRMLFFPHDMDFFETSRTRPLIGGGAPPVLNRLVSHPPYKRIFLGNVVDLVTTGYEPSYFRSWADDAASRCPESRSGT